MRIPRQLAVTVLTGLVSAGPVLADDPGLPGWSVKPGITLLVPAP
jgi:hypothetical protein